MDHFDLAVVGAGPAGLATAIGATLRGLSVVVIERRLPPLDKACGEGLMPAAVLELERLGVVLPAWGQHVVRGIRYVDGPHRVEARFQGALALGVRRVALAEALRTRAAALGVRLCFGARLLRWVRDRQGVELTVRSGADTDSHGPGIVALRANLLVGADGLHSAVRRDLGLTRPPKGVARYGIRRHYALEPWTDHVEVYWAEGAEAYVTPVGPQLVGVAVLWQARGPGGISVGAGVKSPFERLLSSFEPLTARLAEVPVASEARGAGPFSQRARRCHNGPVALVGDAAGCVDPLTGEGVALALLSARVLVETIAGRRPLLRYARAQRRLFRHYELVTRGALLLAQRPALRRRIVGAFVRQPELFTRLIQVSSAGRPLHYIGFGGALRLLAAAAGVGWRDRPSRSAV